MTAFRICAVSDSTATSTPAAIGARPETLSSVSVVENVISSSPPDDDTLKELRARGLGLTLADARAALDVVPGAERFAAEKHLRVQSVFSDQGSGDIQDRKSVV